MKTKSDQRDDLGVSHIVDESIAKSRWAIPLGLAMIVLGVYAIAFPLFIAITSTLFLGWVFLFAGIAQMIYAFQVKGVGHIIGKLVLGLLYFLSGIFVLINPMAGALTITLIMGVTIFLQGIVQVVMSLQARRVSSTWVWMLISGLIGIVLGIYIWNQLSSVTPWLIGTLVGVNLLFDGIWMLTLHSGRRDTLDGHLEVG